jgi:hypothetical protein
MLVATAAAALFAAGPAAAETAAGATADQGFLRTERLVTGRSLSTSWRNLEYGTARSFDQIGGDGVGSEEQEIGAAARPVETAGEQGPSRTGEKVKAGALSLVLPGAGQFYNGDRTKAYVMAGVEVGIWVTYFVFDNQGDNSMESAKTYAGIYAGTRGDQPDAYWRAVGQYMDSDAYNEAVLREARATQTPATGLIGEDRAWQWVNAQRRDDYQGLRADANNAYDRRDFMILFAVVNRAVAVVDAVMGAGKHNGALETEVMGMNLSLGMLPSWQDPGARCTVSRSF